MAADADTAAHDEAMQEGDDRLGEIEKPRVHAVFVLPEAATVIVIACAACLIHLRQIAARTEGLVAGQPVDDQQAHGRVIRPEDQRLVDLKAHLPGQRVQRLGAVEGDAARAALDAAVNVLHYLRSASICRAMITRMISFVPSRI